MKIVKYTWIFSRFSNLFRKIRPKIEKFCDILKKSLFFNKRHNYLIKHSIIVTN